MTVFLITLVLALLLAACVVAYVALPLLRPTRTVWVDEGGPLADLILRKDTLLQSIKELDFDYQTGKLSEEDFQRMDQRQRQQAIVLLRQIEQTMPAAAGLEAEIEEAIRRRRVAPDRSPTTTSEAMTCARCQSAVRSTDKFCPNCGFGLQTALAQQS